MNIISPKIHFFLNMDAEKEKDDVLLKARYNFLYIYFHILHKYLQIK